MLVSFNFECIKCGIYDVFFNTTEYPDRLFPEEINCKECNALSYRLPANCGMISDTFNKNRSGVDIDPLNLKEISSKSYLRRYLKTNGISQLGSDEVGHHTKQKTKKERLQEYLDKPEITRKRKEIISESLEQCGVN